jgi:hypothetical protein
LLCANQEYQSPTVYYILALRIDTRDDTKCQSGILARVQSPKIAVAFAFVPILWTDISYHWHGVSRIMYASLLSPLLLFAHKSWPPRGCTDKHRKKVCLVARVLRSTPETHVKLELPKGCLYVELDDFTRSAWFRGRGSLPFIQRWTRRNPLHCL